MTGPVPRRVLAALAGALVTLVATPGAWAAAARYEITSRNTPLPQFVTTGDSVPISFKTSTEALAQHASLRLDGREVTASMQPDGTPGSRSGTVAGLAPGINTFRLYKSASSSAPLAELKVTRAMAPTTDCAALAATAGQLPAQPMTITLAQLNPASGSLPEHCQIDGDINRRTGIDGQSYGIRFRIRMPTAWNTRFYMGGGGGTNGSLVDPSAFLNQGFATLGTDSGHNNAINNDPNAGGTGSFGVDPQARKDFGYNAYDQVTLAGKALVNLYYGRTAAYSYFQGCSEGGREGVLMSQRFPHHYDGIIAGDPVIHLPMGPMNGVYTSQIFAGLATRMGLSHSNGQPALNKTYTDADLLLVRNSILATCDGLDGLTDGIVDNLPACTAATMRPALAALTCPGDKTASCLTADQIASLELAYNGPTGIGVTNSAGESLYPNWPWDAGISGQNGSSYNTGWRSWWLGSYASTTNNATKFAFVGVLAVAYTTPPVLPFNSANDTLPYVLAYDWDIDPPKILTATTDIYTEPSSSTYFTVATDLSAFRNRGAKMMLYHGGADSSVSLWDTVNWYNAMNGAMGGTAQSFARLFPVPGMNHCSGGPATSSFDMLPQLMGWVESGVAPDSVIANAPTPGYFGVASRSRPLCPYPKQTRYKGSGDINVAASFQCVAP